MSSEAALMSLLGSLAARHYRWVAPTPETQRRVLARANRRVATSLPGIFGWSLPFAPEIVDVELLGLMRTADIVERRGDLLASTVRVSSLDNDLFLHSAYPTTGSDAVFFGPDSYRFARFIRDGLSRMPTEIRRLVDIGCGSGVGAVIAARATGAPHVVMTDINPAALRLARINAAAADVAASADISDVLNDIDGTFDLVVSNPPYLIDDERRTYRHGGDALGADLSLRIANDAVARLNPGGRLLLYTASAIVDGVDGFRSAVMSSLEDKDCEVGYAEIDPDVFGEELDRSVYRDVDRIAVVGVTATRRQRP
jgi:methylase of polypeptide subunit release factors